MPSLLCLFPFLFFPIIQVANLFRFFPLLITFFIVRPSVACKKLCGRRAEWQPFHCTSEPRPLFWGEDEYKQTQALMRCLLVYEAMLGNNMYNECEHTDKRKKIKNGVTREWIFAFSSFLTEKKKKDFQEAMASSSGSYQGSSGLRGLVRFCSCHSSNITVADMVAATKAAAATRCKNADCLRIHRRKAEVERDDSEW